jgi:RNA polymerase primary sigma factor
MKNIHEKKKIYNEIYMKYSIQGYLTSDYIFNVLLKYELTLSEIEYFCEDIIRQGVLIISEDKINNYIIDYSSYDYSKVYNEVIYIDTNLKYIINYVKSIKPPQKNEFETLFIQSKNGNEYARNRIIKMNMRIAIRYALYFHKKYKYPLDEAIQESFSALVIVINSYSVDKGNYSNFLQWHIRQSLCRSVSPINYLIKCPQYLKNDLLKITKYLKNRTTNYIICNKIKIKYNIRKLINCNKNRTNILYFCLLKPYSIENLLGRHKMILSDEETFIDYINRNMTNYNLHNVLLNILSTLPIRESCVLKYRYGIGIEKSHTLDEIGEIYNLTRERIRQIENKAIKRMNNHKQFKILKYFFE